MLSPDIVTDITDNRVCEGTGPEDLVDTHLLHGGDVFRRKGAARNQQDTIHLIFLHLRHDLGGKNQMLSR